MGENIPLSMQNDYLKLKSLGKLSPEIMKNLEEKRGHQALGGDSQMPGFHPDAAGGLLATQMGVDNGQLHTHPHYHGPGEQHHQQAQQPPQRPPQQPPQPPQQPPQPPQQPPQPPQQPPQQPPGPPPGFDKINKVEIHMVYGAWCGHSKRALPAFEDLVKVTDATTSKGTPVKFVLTEDKSPEFEKFKKKVRGFPTYMAVVKENDNILGMEEMKLPNREKDTILESVKSIIV